MSIPSYPQGSPASAGSRTAPPSVLTAAKLMYAGAFLSVCGIVAAVVTADELSGSLSDSGDSGTEVSNGLVIGLAVATGLIGTFLWLWMAWATKAGRNWARITSAVLFGVATLMTLIGLTDPGDAATVVISVLSWLVGLGALVLLYRPDTRAHFSKAPTGQM